MVCASGSISIFAQRTASCRFAQHLLSHGARFMTDPFPTCYLNGEYLPLAQARISPLDRGFLYGDGAYEVMPVYGGRPFRLEAHCARLTRSLGEIRMADPLSRSQWC